MNKAYCYGGWLCLPWVNPVVWEHFTCNQGAFHLQSGSISLAIREHFTCNQACQHFPLCWFLLARWPTARRLHPVRVADHGEPGVCVSPWSHSGAGQPGLHCSGPLPGLDRGLQLCAWWRLHPWAHRLAHPHCHGIHSSGTEVRWVS